MASRTKSVTYKDLFSKGVLSQNPVLKMLLGFCPALAVTTNSVNALGMGLATTFVLIGSNAAISVTARHIPDNVRIPAYIVLIASFVGVVELFIKAYYPELDAALGIFIPLIAVNCVVLGRAEAFANRNGMFLSVVDGVAMGLGFTIALLLLGIVREVFGAGAIFGIPLVAEDVTTMLIFALPPGAFVVLGLIIALVNYIEKLGAKK